MTTLSIKIVGVEGDSVMVKYATDASAKSIDDYEAVAYQPKSMGYTSVDDFLNGIKSGLLGDAMFRDRQEQISNTSIDLTAWDGATAEHSIPSVVVTTQSIPTFTQPEVIL